MHNVSAKCAKLTRSKADWRMIGIDYEDDIEVVENRRVKIEERRKFTRQDVYIRTKFLQYR